MKHGLKLITMLRAPRYKIYLFVLLGLMQQFNTSAQSSNLVWIDNGSLSYAQFAMEGQSNMVNTIPDYSFAGYKGGGVTIPIAPVQITLSPSGGNDTQMIQNAIDMVESLPLDANGFRGAVLLTTGCYEVDQLFIEKSGVVLRGEGQGIDGTVLFASLQIQHNVINVQGSGSGFQKDNASKQEITTAYVPVGTHSFDVENASAYSVGDTIVVVRTPNQFWIDDLGMDQATLCGGDTGCGGWTPGSYTINHERVITGISGNTVTVDLPIVDVMETQYGGGEIYKVSVPGRIEQCGIENLRIESYYDPANPEDENHAWIGVLLKRTVNSWVANVTGQHLGYATVSITSESNFNTIQECATVDPVSQITGGRRYSFNLSDGVGNLFQRNYTRGGRHDFVTGSRVTGPNVFLDNYSTNTYSDIGPHHRWATGLLFDNVRGGQIRVQNRGNSGSGHGWAGNTTMFWNLLSQDQDIKVESPKGGINWGIGCVGVQQNGAGYWESWNSNVLPRSLYLQQLEDRLGLQAVNNITIPEQLNGNIYSLLATWAGEYDFGVPANTQQVFVTEDAFVRAGSYSDLNYGNDDQLIVKNNNGTSNVDRRSFIKFDLSKISGPIYNVKLWLNVTNDAPNPAQNSVHLVTDDSWSENIITWNNQPTASTFIETKDVPAQGGWLEYDITSYANAEISGDGILSLRLSEATNNNYYAFASKEENGNSLDPRLVYEISSQPSPSVCSGAPCPDGDNDGVCDVNDQCPGFDDTIDTDGDGIADGCDTCPNDNPDDTDGDGVCDSNDQCPGFDDTIDTDGDGIADGCDLCPGFDDTLDTDGDGISNGCDICPNDNPNDTDGDGICDSNDQCPGFDDAVDTDGDGTADGCDPCPNDNPDDTDGDGVCDSNDQCPGFDDTIDTDGDGTPDGCDICPNDNPNDTDGDGVCDSNDQCPGNDDSLIGTACDDGLANTIGDVYDNNCNCSGSPAQTGSLEVYLNTYLSSVPGSSGEDYSVPSGNDLLNWESTISNILSDNIVAAENFASNYNYHIKGFIDNAAGADILYYILEENDPKTNHWGTYVFNLSACRDDLVIQAPHPKNDLNTGKQAVYSFVRLNSFALFLSGTHRCNSNVNSTCDGTTSVCTGSSAPYRITDMAHNTNTAFQKTTDVVSTTLGNTVFIQLHGFTKLETDPYVIMSNGSRQTPTIDYATSIKDELLAVDNSLTFKIGHIDLSWNRLLGFTNTQGRLLNLSPDPCNTHLDQSEGRFIHIEQEKTKLRDDATGWHKMYLALANSFDCTNCSFAGTNCDDGDVCTTGDVFDSSCNCVGTFSDNDNDGVCTAQDPDDNDPCNPDSNQPGCDPCNTFITDGFDSGFGNWNDGGSDCARTTLFPNSGTHSVRIRDNSGNGSSVFSDAFDLVDYDEVVISFSYYPESMENGEDFMLEYSLNNGSSYSTIQTWVANTDFSNLNRYDESVSVTGISFNSQTRFRFRCDASNNGDRIYLDDISIETCGGTCTPGSSCEDGDDCTTNDVYDANCNCAGTFIDSDGDTVCDANDQCPGFDDLLDGDGDNIPDDCDICPNDNPNDTDGDGVCDSNDQCPGFDDNVDTDGDGTADGCDPCPLDNPNDSDNDGVCDSNDQCPGLDDALAGTSCPDDGDDCTVDLYDSNCNCIHTYTDQDGDGVCIGQDADDNDPCIPNQQSPACDPCTDITSDGFETNFGNWNDGGNDCSRVTGVNYSGSYSVRLRDNSSSSVLTSDALDLLANNSVEISFFYYPESMENGEDFFLDYSLDNGSSYFPYTSWVSGTDFSNNSWYEEIVTVDGIVFSGQTRFRFRCDASNNADKIFLDDILIKHCEVGSIPAVENQNPLSFDLATEKGPLDLHAFPIPTLNKLYIDITALNGQAAELEIFSIDGTMVKNYKYEMHHPNLIELDLFQLHDGLYIIRISNELIEYKPKLIIKSSR